MNSSFSYSPIDRDALMRIDSLQLEKILNSPHSRVLLWYEGKLITRENQTLYFLYNEIKGLDEVLSKPVYLGRQRKLNYFAMQLKQWQAEFDGLELISLRAASLTVNDYHLGLLYHAQGILNWHRNHAYCAACGSATHMTHAGHARQCNNSDCAKQHYPRIDPAVIFSVINNTGPEARILLARQPGWEENRYSVLAGYVEPGETLEDAVKREALEETGIQLDSVDYVASQPWPFPGQIMLGFSCITRQSKISLLDQELECANWYSTREISKKILSGELKMPFRASLSWHLINRWYVEHTGADIE